jgi:transcription elongation factor Elf1
MWMGMLFSHSSATFITSCPMGHERAITVDQRTPAQEWTLTCPICGDQHQLRAPQIISSDL